MITNKELNEAVSKFDVLERRGSFYDMAVGLINNGFEIEAYCLILATWNFAAFRYAVKDFDLVGFRQTIEKLNSRFSTMEVEDFRIIDFDKYRDDIVAIFETLCHIRGIQYTGASKVMHLRNRSVFVMWDGYISGDKPKKYYDALDIVKRRCWRPKRYQKNGEGYFQFLKDTQDLFKNMNIKNHRRTFTKAIDEYNYVNITLLIQDMEREAQEKRRKSKN